MTKEFQKILNGMFDSYICSASIIGGLLDCYAIGLLTIHVKFWKCQCGRFIRKSEGLGKNGILYVNRRLLEKGATVRKLGF